VRPGIPHPDFVAVGADGTSYALNVDALDVERVSTNGAVLDTWPLPPDLKAATGLAIDEHDTLYVTNDNTQGIYTFSPTGRSLATWSVGPVQALAIDGGGTVFALQVGAQAPTILKLSPDGNIMARMPAKLKTIIPGGTFDCPGGSCPVEVGAPQPSGLTVAPDGTIFDALSVDVEAGKGTSTVDVIQARSPSGALLAEQKVDGPPSGLAAASNGDLIAAIPLQDVLRFDPKLSKAIVIATEAACGPSTFREISGLAVDGQGNIYVTDPIDGNIHKFSSTGAPLAVLGDCPSREADQAEGIAVDAAGTIYVAVSGRGRLMKLAPGGADVGEWDITNPQDVAIGPHGNVFVSSDDGAVRLFSPGGKLLRTFRFPDRLVPGTWISGRFVPDFPRYSVAVDRQGNLYEAESSTPIIVKFGPAGRLLATWDKRKAPQPDQYEHIYGLGIDRYSDLLVADLENDRVQRLSSSFKTLGTWHVDGSADVATDAKGNVYTVGFRDDRVRELGPSGNVLGLWGGPGTGPGQFARAMSIAVGGKGNVFVADTGNNRIQKLAPAPQTVKAGW
jgi:sugar lactone lactonase YvrE